MLKPLMYVVGIVSLALSVWLLRNDMYEVSGLMLLSFGIVTLLVASVLNKKKSTK